MASKSQKTKYSHCEKRKKEGRELELGARFFAAVLVSRIHRLRRSTAIQWLFFDILNLFAFAVENQIVLVEGAALLFFRHLACVGGMSDTELIGALSEAAG